MVGSLAIACGFRGTAVAVPMKPCAGAGK